MTRLLHPKTGGLGLLAAAILSLPLLLDNPFHMEVAINVGFNAIVCVGLNLLIGYAGQISLGHAAFVGLGAYGAGVLTANHDWDALTAMGVSAVGTGLLAFVLARPILKLKGHYLAMATLGMGIIIAIVINIEDQITGGPDGMVVPALNLFGWEPADEGDWYWMIGGLLWVSVWLALNLVDSPVGRALRAVHGSEVAAEVVGVDSSHYKVLIFVVSAVFASVVGSLNAFYSQFITPEIASFFHSIEFVVMVVLGGMASTYGAVIGAAILTLLPQVLTVLEDYEHLIFGLILMLVMIFMPKGLLPTIINALKRRRT
ncbi:branched-chain amino acid ABC transporter permease [Magnetospira sp. QH-2]|uniref:branched-chain amino acid ABC transporter permease n=1 Tax=Magnetospira sp. (strain QH-2) TaxID=1288970 RepID=UPI0003E80F6F|nr:branched-chain amino acid ABC transporter permease [Magnetospira sp. QH-2]CCQ74560.1 putative ABC-type branched-chain amino acid transport system [Magnetospira sp. QH-2]